MANLDLTTISSELLPLTQKNYLNKLVRPAIQPEFVWRNAASLESENYPTRVGMPEIITVRGLMAPNTVPNNVSAISDPLAGMTFSGAQSYEQFTGKFDRYDNLLSADLHGKQFPIIDKVEENYIANAQKAASTADFLARNALYDVYTGGNTFLTANASSAATSISVDDVRGFVVPTDALGEVATQYVWVNGEKHTLTGVNATGTSGLAFTDSTGTFGKAGTLTISPGLTAGATAGAKVFADAAPAMVHAGNRNSYNGIQSGDLLTAAMIRKGAGKLSQNRIPKINGAYTLYADNLALQGLFQDAEFQNMFRGGYDSSVWQSGEITKMLGVRIVEVTSSPMQVNGSITVCRPMLVGAGALTEFQATDRSISDVGGPVHIHKQDNIAFITRLPIDPANQFLLQSYLMFVGYAARTDRLVTSAVIPTATNANYKRAVTLVCAGAN